jgi:DNA-directed RNA polymerase specialized sigma24 family protein
MSDVLELPEKTVKSRLYDARQLLRDRLLQRGIL